MRFDRTVGLATGFGKLVHGLVNQRSESFHRTVINALCMQIATLVFYNLYTSGCEEHTLRCFAASVRECGCLAYCRVFVLP